MGEAKRRKENDPLYGRVPKDRRERGIIIGPPTQVEGTSLRMSTNLDPIELRTWLLFWDKLVWPDNPFVGAAMSPDYEYLISTGVLERPTYGFSGDVAQGILKGYIDALREKESIEPECWSIAQGEQALHIIGNDIPDSKDMLVRLYNAVPIPAGDVPFAEILEFKHRRLPELYRFRDEIERLYEEIAKSSVKEFSLQRRVEKIEQACADLIKVNKEWKFGSLLSNWSFSITPTEWFTAVSGFVGGQMTNWESVSSLIAGTVGAGIALTPAVGKRILEKQRHPYRYAALAHKELQF